jgi:hypothetical protein
MVGGRVRVRIPGSEDANVNSGDAHHVHLGGADVVYAPVFDVDAEWLEGPLVQHAIQLDWVHLFVLRYPLTIAVEYLLQQQKPPAA